MLRWALIALLLGHAAVTFATLDGETLWAVFPPFRERFVYQMFSDIVCSIGIVFLVSVARLRERGRSLKGAWLMLASAAAVGSFAPLIYLLVEKDLFKIR